jgi:hypothetical protein
MLSDAFKMGEINFRQSSRLKENLQSMGTWASVMVRQTLQIIFLQYINKYSEQLSHSYMLKV